MVPSSSTSSENVPQQKKIWTSDEIKSFYKDKVTGMIDPKLADKIAADIEAAALEGRIVR